MLERTIVLGDLFIHVYILRYAKQARGMCRLIRNRICHI